MRFLFIISLLTTVVFYAEGQELGKPSLRGDIEVPLQLGNTDWRNFTEGIVAVDLCFNYPIVSGVGIGAGAKGSFTVLERGGDIFRSGFYGKVFYESMLGPSTMFEGSIKTGVMQYSFFAEGCPKQTLSAFHADPSVALHFFANEFTSFGFTLGYEIDAAEFTPELVCDDPNVQLYSLDGGYFRHITFGLAFNVLFGERPSNNGGVFN